jgi:diguanylate cyclase (GGDEF)-like protein/PAS domain S-box-containing protein
VSWQVSAAANGLVAACYFAISWVVLSGLLRTKQLRSNALGLATSLIFLTCAVHHGSHAVHLLLPLVVTDAHGMALRQAFGWQMAAWDVVGAIVACVYLSLRSSFGRLLQTPAMFRDLAQSRVDEAIAREHDALTEAQALARMGSWRREQDGTWTTSEEYRRLLELGPDDDPSLSWEKVHPDDAGRLRAIVAAARDGVGGETPYRLLRSDGAYRRLELRVRPERDGTGAIVAVAGTVQDVTERVEMESAVRQAEQRFRVAFDASPIGVGMMSTGAEDQGRIVSANLALAELLGTTVERLEGCPLLSLTHPEDHGALHAVIGRLGDHGTGRAESEVRLRHRDGRYLWTVLSAAPLPEGDRLAVFNVMDVSQRKQFENQLQYLADHDALTGLFNRRRFTEELGRTLRHTERYRDPGAVLFLDLDGFKFVNDSLGHAVGDELIARVGSVFASAVRETDIVARVGGDEFAIILMHADEVAAIAVAEQLLDTVRRHGIAVTPGHRAQISTSIGIALFTAEDDVTADELLVEADIAMYEAKDSGKDRYRIYRREEDQPRVVSVRENWSRRLHEAVDAGDFVLHAQPIVPLSPDPVPAFELLLRLPDGHGDLIPPGSFLYNAERFGLITRIVWVLGQAIGLLSASHRADVDLRLSVNVSGHSMTDPALGPHIAELLAAHPVRRDRLVIEITETAAITNIERARTLAAELRALGCQIALDDFGAGFASFYYLKHLQFDYLKIDGEFIRSLTTTTTDQLVVQALVDIARGLGARTIAEFVADEDSVRQLTVLGVDHAQGFHVGRPAALEQRLPHLLRTAEPTTPAAG